MDNFLLKFIAYSGPPFPSQLTANNYN